MSRDRKAVFLDRDGVLTVPDFRDGRSYAPRTLDAFAVYEEAPAAVRRLRKAGFLILVATNQPDVGAGLLSFEALEEMHRRLAAEVEIDSIEVCTHTASQSCDCRKPQPGMLRRAAARLGIDLEASYMVGDRSSDMQAARAAGCRAVFIDLGYTAEAAPDDIDIRVAGIGDAADWIITDDRAAHERQASDIANAALSTMGLAR